MADNKYLWRAKVAGIANPIYLIAQNMPSAYAAVSSHPQVQPEDVSMMHRVDPWDEAQNMTVVNWPEPPPDPDLPNEPPP